MQQVRVLLVDESEAALVACLQELFRRLGCPRRAAHSGAEYSWPDRGRTARAGRAQGSVVDEPRLARFKPEIRPIHCKQVARGDQESSFSALRAPASVSTPMRRATLAFLICPFWISVAMKPKAMDRPSEACGLIGVMPLAMSPPRSGGSACAACTKSLVDAKKLAAAFSVSSAAP